MQKLSNQEVFDKVARHLLIQGKQSLNSGKGDTPICLYRGPNGLKCAIDCLLSDDLAEAFDKRQDSTSVVSLSVDGLLPEDLREVDLALLIRLQGLHDDASVLDWPKGLMQIAGAFELVPPVELLAKLEKP